MTRLNRKLGSESWSLTRRVRWRPLQPDLHQHDRYAGLAEVGWVAVVPHMQGRRLGSVVTQAVIGEAEERGRREVFLRTDDWRLPAVVSYLRLGFRPWFDRAHRAGAVAACLLVNSIFPPAPWAKERCSARGNLAERAIAGRRTGDAGIAGDACGTTRGEGMARQHADIAIIGAGIVGLSSAYELAGVRGQDKSSCSTRAGRCLVLRAGRRGLSAPSSWVTRTSSWGCSVISRVLELAGEHGLNFEQRGRLQVVYDPG